MLTFLAGAFAAASEDPSVQVSLFGTRTGDLELAGIRQPRTVVIPPGAAIPEHDHAPGAYEAIVVLYGTVTVKELDGESVVLNTGDFAVAVPHTRHMVTNDSATCRADLFIVTITRALQPAMPAG